MLQSYIYIYNITYTRENISRSCRNLLLKIVLILENLILTMQRDLYRYVIPVCEQSWFTYLYLIMCKLRVLTKMQIDIVRAETKEGNDIFPRLRIPPARAVACGVSRGGGWWKWLRRNDTDFFGTEYNIIIIVDEDFFLPYIESCSAAAGRYFILFYSSTKKS